MWNEELIDDHRFKVHYIRPRLFLICLVRWFSLPSDPRLSHIWFWASIRRVTSSVQSSSSRNVGRSVVVTFLTRLACVTIERCPKELPSTNTISQLIQDTSTFSKLIVAAKWRLILFRSLSENESRSFLHLFSWIRKNNKDLCVYECMWNAHSLSDRLWSPPQPSLNPTFARGSSALPWPNLVSDADTVIETQWVTPHHLRHQIGSKFSTKDCSSVQCK